MRNISEEVPPINEVWKEASCLTPQFVLYPSVHTYQRRMQLRGLLRDITVLVSLEEVFGKGLLERHSEEIFAEHLARHGHVPK